MSPKESKLQCGDIVEGGGVLLGWGSARWPRGRADNCIQCCLGQVLRKRGKQSNRDSWRVTQLTVALPQKNDEPSSQQKEYNPHFSVSGHQQQHLPQARPIPAPAAAQSPGHSKGCSKDQHMSGFCFSALLSCSYLFSAGVPWTLQQGKPGGVATKGVWMPQRWESCEGQVPLKHSIKPVVKPRTDSNIFWCFQNRNTILILLLVLCRLNEKFNVQAAM